MVEAADKIFAVNDNLTDWAKVLFVHARTAFVMHQMEETFSLCVAVCILTGIATSPNERTPLPGAGMYLALAESDRRNIPGFMAWLVFPRNVPVLNLDKKLR